MAIHITVAVRGTVEDIERPFACGMKSAASTAFEDAGAFVFGDHALNLQKQILFRRRADSVIEKDKLDTSAFEFVKEKDLVGILSSKTIRSQDVEAIDEASSGEIAKAFQSRTQQSGAGIAVIDETQVVVEGEAIMEDTLRNELNLAIDGMFFGLLIGGYADIECNRERRLGSHEKVS